MSMYVNTTYRRGEVSNKASKVDGIHTKSCCVQDWMVDGEAKSVRSMQCNIAVTNKHTAKLHHVGSLYILTYDARKPKHRLT